MSKEDNKRYEHILEEFPYSIEMKYPRNGFMNSFLYMFKDAVKETLEKHNKKHSEKIELGIHCRSSYEQEVAIIVKNDTVYTIDTEIQKKNGWTLQSALELCGKVKLALKDTLNSRHDEIIGQQKLNELKVEKAKQEEDIKFLFEYYYYFVQSDEKSLTYVKKLANRYKNSDFYARKLYWIYRNLAYKYKNKNFLRIVKAMENEESRELF